MKPEGPLVRRVAIAIVFVASAWFLFAAAWGMGAIPGGGHLGSGSAGTFMAAEQIVRWKIPYPARAWYSGVRPEGATLMCHHPYGQYYVPALLYWLFGHHDWLLHLPAIALSLWIPPLLYGIARERWGAASGAVAAASYVVVPIAVGFASYWNLETICIFGSLLFFWGHSRHVSTGRGRYLVASLAGLTIVCSGDWIGYVLVAPTLGWAFLRAFVLPRQATPSFDQRAYSRWWALSVVLMAVELALWVGLFVRADQIPQWLGAAEYRGGGGVGTLTDALRARRGWIDFSFTPLAIALGKLAVPVCAARLVVLRRDEETYSLGLLVGGVIQYVTFKRGADVHVFWPHYFAAYFALSLAQLASTAGAVVRRFRFQLARPEMPVASAAVLAVGLLPAAAMAHDGVKSLWVWRRTGGRYDDNGSAIRSHVDVLSVLDQVLVPAGGRGMLVDAHPSIAWGWEFLWRTQSVATTVAAPAAGISDVTHPRFWIARASGMTADEQRKIARTAHVRVYGDAWVVDQREPPAPLDAYSLGEREPDLLEWLLYGGTEPVRSIGTSPDPWATWEWRVHLGQPATVPEGEPKTLDELRIAYNVAVERGDASARARLRGRIEGALDQHVAAEFTEGIRLMGVRVTGGVQPRVESWFEFAGAGGPRGAWFCVRSTVEARETFSLVGPDPTDREMAFPAPLSTSLWKPGFLYVADVVANHRIGVERYWGMWRTREGSPIPRRSDGQQRTTLATLM